MEQAQVDRINAFCGRARSAPFDPAAFTLAYGGVEDAHIEKYNIHVENPGKKPNRVYVRQEPRSGPSDIRIRFFAEGGEVFVDGSNQVRGTVRQHANDCRTVIGGDNKQPSPFNITHWSRRSLVHIGRGATSNGANLVAMGEGAAILIGEDCMFSTGIWVKSSDMHTIVDLETDTMVNRFGNAGDIEIGRHVWLGQDVQVTLGVKVGSGAILGAKSLIREDVPERTLWAGVPARQLRENVTWLRAHVLLPQELEQVRTSLGLEPKAGS
jgi:acetyltransferase-like isoleucine patch superfamily enzyme